MTFVRKKANTTPIVDTVFAIVDKAKKDKEEMALKMSSMQRLVLYMEKMKNWLLWMKFSIITMPLIIVSKPPTHPVLPAILIIARLFTTG